MGEDGLLIRLRDLLERASPHLEVGIGDDAAVSSSRIHPERLVWTIDSMVEETHFRFWPGVPSPTWLGNMIARANISDIAAMAAAPLFGLLSLGVPPSARVEDIQAFMQGLEDALSAAGAHLIGGDTVRSPQWMVTLALTGTLRTEAIIPRRSDALPGDGLWITGTPGRHGAGLRILEEGDASSPECGLVQDYLCSPCTTVSFAAALASFSSRLAMIDLSDGLARDAGRLAAASGAGLIIEERCLPIAGDLADICSERAWNPVDLALHGGEDHELLFASSVDPEMIRSIGEKEGVVVARIGTVDEGRGVRFRTIDGTVTDLKATGFEHFQHD